MRPHRHEWSTDGQWAHCLHCDLTLRQYAEWLEAVAKRAAQLNALTEASPAVRELIAEARQHDLGSTLAWEDEDYLREQAEEGVTR